MDLRFTSRGFDGCTCCLKRQLGLIAFFAQVQQDHMPRRSLVRACENCLEQFGALGVGEMPRVAQVPLDQKLGPAGSFLHPDVVVEFKADQVDSGEAFGNRRRPAAAIGQITDSDRRLAALGRGFNAKTERRSAVMRHLDRLKPQPVRYQKRMVVIAADRAAFLELLESGVLGQGLAMTLVAVDGRAPAGKLVESGRVDVVGMGVSEHNRSDP